MAWADYQKTKTLFSKMIITKAPYRVSFFGGGTDYDHWYQQHQGAFLSMAFDRYCYAFLKPFTIMQDTKYRVTWRITEEINNIDDIQQPVVRESLRLYDYNAPLEINYVGDLPSQSGIGSSSSFTAAMLCGLEALKPTYGHDAFDIAKNAYKIEHDMLNEHIGVQDSIAAAHGGFNFVHINHDGDYRINPIILNKDNKAKFLERLLLVYTQESRHATDFAKQKIEVMDKKQQSFQQFYDMAHRAYDYVLNMQLDDFGDLLHESWLLKSSLTDRISTKIANELYDYARQYGAMGGKLLGAGGGGFFLLYCHEGQKQTLKNALKDNYRFIDIAIAEQTQVIYNQDKQL